jgi:large subunit ribosomal protein L17
MRHGKKINHLGRTSSHRKAMLSNMASSLILHKRIETTIAKAKELRKYVEPLLTKAKSDTTIQEGWCFPTFRIKTPYRFSLMKWPIESLTGPVDIPGLLRWVID